MTELPAPERAALDAASTGAFLACFPHDGVLDDWGRRFRGHEAIRRRSDREFIGVQVTLAVTESVTHHTRSRSWPR